MFVLLSFLVVASFAKAPCPNVDDANACAAARVDNDPHKPYLNCIYDGKKSDPAEKCYQLTVGKLDLKALNDEKLSWNERITRARRTIDYEDVIQMPDGTVERIAISNDGAATVNYDAEGKVTYAQIEEDGKVHMFQKNSDGFIETSADLRPLAEFDDVFHEEESDHLEEVAVSDDRASQAKGCDATNVQKPANENENWLLRTEHYYTEQALKRWKGSRERKLQELYRLIGNQVSKANLIFANSKIPLRIVVESLKFLPYKGDHFPEAFDKPDTSSTLGNYKPQTDHIADPGPKRVVVIWCQTDHISNPAWVYGVPYSMRTFLTTEKLASGNPFPDWALRKMWMGVGKNLNTYTFGHELGHLLGLSHNYKANGANDQNCPGCGVFLECDGIRTIMSYSYNADTFDHPLPRDAFAVPEGETCQGSEWGARIPYYSSRMIKYTDPKTGKEYVLGNDKVHSDECVLVALSGMGPADIDPCNALPATEASCTSARGHICKVIRHETNTVMQASVIKTTHLSCKAVGFDPQTYIQLYTVLNNRFTSSFTAGFLHRLCKGGKRQVTMNGGTEHIFDPATCEEVVEANSKRLTCRTTTDTKITFSGSTTERIGANLKSCTAHQTIVDNIKNVEEQVAASSSNALNQHGLLLLFAFIGLLFYVGFHFGRQKEDHVYEHLMDEI